MDKIGAILISGGQIMNHFNKIKTPIDKEKLDIELEKNKIFNYSCKLKEILGIIVVGLTNYMMIDTEHNVSKYKKRLSFGLNIISLFIVLMTLYNTFLYWDDYME